jgi:hypothetical protein
MYVVRWGSSIISTGRHLKIDRWVLVVCLCSAASPWEPLKKSDSHLAGNIRLDSSDRCSRIGTERTYENPVSTYAIVGRIRYY